MVLGLASCAQHKRSDTPTKGGEGEGLCAWPPYMRFNRDKIKIQYSLIARYRIKVSVSRIKLLVQYSIT